MGGCGVGGGGEIAACCHYRSRRAKRAWMHDVSSDSAKAVRARVRVGTLGPGGASFDTRTRTRLAPQWRHGMGLGMGMQGQILRRCPAMPRVSFWQHFCSSEGGSFWFCRSSVWSVQGTCMHTHTLSRHPQAPCILLSHHIPAPRCSHSTNLSLRSVEPAQNMSGATVHVPIPRQSPPRCS